MHARVTRWEGTSEDDLRRVAEEINSSDGPPPGVPAKGITMLVGADGGHSITITLFETEEDLREGDATLNAMDPGDDFGGRRVSVDMYEVAVDRRL